MPTASDERDYPQLDGLETSEHHGATIVARALGATPTRYDVGARQGAHDIDLTYDDGRTAALELTTLAGDGRRQLDELMARARTEWTNPGQMDWWIEIKSMPAFGFIEDNYAYLIALMESHGVGRAEKLPDHLWFGDPIVKGLLARGNDLQMRGTATDTPGRFTLATVDGGEIANPVSRLDSAVAEALAVRSVAKRVRKLQRVTDRDERHLYIGVGLSGLPFDVAAGIMRGGALPKVSTLELPDGLTHLWLAVQFSDRLLCHTGGRWVEYDRAV